MINFNPFFARTKRLFQVGSPDRKVMDQWVLRQSFQIYDSLMGGSTSCAQKGKAWNEQMKYPLVLLLSTPPSPANCAASVAKLARCHFSFPSEASLHLANGYILPYHHFFWHPALTGSWILSQLSSMEAGLHPEWVAISLSRAERQSLSTLTLSS